MALRPISRIDDFRFPAGAWDVRGWKVRTAPDDKKVGQVDDMLLDPAGQLRYLDIDLGFMKKHVLVPLHRSRADRENETVWVEGVSKERLEEAPEYALQPESLDESFERRLDAYFDTHSVNTDASATGTPAAHGTPAAYGAAAPAGAAMGAPPMESVELRRMTDLEKDYEVAGHDPRGWKVVTGEGETVGQVAELLVAPGEMKARYLDVAVDEKALRLERVDRHVLLPSERVQLDHGSKKVVVAGLLAYDLAEYPQYGGLPMADGHARSIYDYFERAGSVDRDGTADPATRAEPAPQVDPSTAGPHVQHFYGQSAPAQRTTEE